MKVLIASVPASGLLNPLLAFGRILIAEGHEVIGLSGSHLRARIESIGAEFQPLPAGADVDSADIIAAVPELKSLPPGPEWLRVAMERVFVDNIPDQHEGLQKVLRSSRPTSSSPIVHSSVCYRCCSGRARNGAPSFCAMNTRPSRGYSTELSMNLWPVG
jgi:hypothetical protein